MNKVPKHLIKEWLLENGLVSDIDPNLDEVVKKIYNNIESHEIDTPYNLDVYHIFKASGCEFNIGIAYFHLN